MQDVMPSSVSTSRFPAIEKAHCGPLPTRFALVAGFLDETLPQLLLKRSFKGKRRSRNTQIRIIEIDECSSGYVLLKQRKTLIELQTNVCLTSVLLRGLEPCSKQIS